MTGSEKRTGTEPSPYKVLTTSKGPPREFELLVSEIPSSPFETREIVPVRAATGPGQRDLRTGFGTSGDPRLSRRASLFRTRELVSVPRCAPESRCPDSPRPKEE